MDIGDQIAVKPILQAISAPENVNHRGTLVYALSGFNCEPFLETLVDLALTGNFEVSTGAFSIIEESIVSVEAASRVRAQLGKYDAGTLVADHHQWALAALSDLVRREA